jgi:hypothetical protein
MSVDSRDPCPYKPGDLVIYTPSARGAALDVMSSPGALLVPRSIASKPSKSVRTSFCRESGIQVVDFIGPSSRGRSDVPAIRPNKALQPTRAAGPNRQPETAGNGPRG